MKIKNKILFPIIFILAAAGFLGYFLFSHTFSALSKNILEKNHDLYVQTVSDFSKDKINQIYNDIDRIGQKALSIASLFSEWDSVIEAYETALSGNIDDEKSPESQEARENLRRLFSPILKGYEKNTGKGLLQLHFHLPNGRSLVRLWRDGFQTTRNGVKIDVSDDLSGFRKTVLDINRGNHSPLTGIETGRGGFVIRGLAPVTSSAGKHMGSDEVLFSFSELIEKARTSDNMFFAVYMDAGLLQIAKSLQDAKKYPVLENKYVLTDDTVPLFL